MDNNFEYYNIDNLAKEISNFLSQKKLKVYTINYNNHPPIDKSIFNTHFSQELSDFLKMRYKKLNKKPATLELDNI